MSDVNHTGVLVRQIVDLLQRDYSHAITLRKLGIAVGRHPGYLGEVFRRETGVPLRAYLTQTRMRHAAELIGRGVKVEAVSLVVGYRGKRNFYRHFKRYFGMTPTQYRSRLWVARRPHTTWRT